MPVSELDKRLVAIREELMESFDRIDLDCSKNEAERLTAWFERKVESALIKAANAGNDSAHAAGKREALVEAAKNTVAIRELHDAMFDTAIDN